MAEIDEHPAVPDAAIGARMQRRVVTQAVGATLLVMFDFNAPLATLTATSRALEATPQVQTWMLSGISLGLASSLLVTGALGDDLGRRRVFGAGLGLLAVATVGAGLAPNAWTFVAARVVQGIASAAVLACGLGLIAQVLPDALLRQRATGFWGASLGAGVALGPLLATWVAGLGTWRAVYLVEGVMALALAGAATRLVDVPPGRSRRFDAPGVVSFVGAITLLLTGLVEGQQGWGRPATTVSLGAGGLLLALFVLVETRRSEPLIEVGLFRSRGFVAAITGALATGLAIIGFMSYLPTVLQRGIGESPTESASVLAIWSGVSAIVALGARWLPGSISARWQLAGGLLLCAVGLLGVSNLTAVSSWVQLVPGLVVTGIGSGILNAALARLAVESVPHGRAGMGSGANNTARYVGSSAGVAVVVAVISGHGSAGLGRSPAAELVGGMNLAALTCAVIAFAGAVVTLIVGAPPRRRTPDDSGTNPHRTF